MDSLLQSETSTSQVLCRNPYSRLSQRRDRCVEHAVCLPATFLDVQKRGSYSNAALDSLPQSETTAGLDRSADAQERQVVSGWSEVLLFVALEVLRLLCLFLNAGLLSRRCYRTRGEVGSAVCCGPSRAKLSALDREEPLSFPFYFSQVSSYQPSPAPPIQSKERSCVGVIYPGNSVNSFAPCRFRDSV